MEYKNITLVGTSHISPESLQEVEEVIKSRKPAIIAIELDQPRLHALMHKKKGRIRLSDIRKIGVKGYLFSIIGSWAEKKLGEYVGVSPGSEMLKAVRMARTSGARLALIDQDISITLKRLSKVMSWKEKWNFFVDVFNAVILRKKDPDIAFDLKKVPSKKLIKKLTDKVKKRYPNIYMVLVDERNEVMGRNLYLLMVQHPKDPIVGIIGAGHEEEIVKIIKRHEALSFGYSFTVGTVGKNI